MSLLPMTNSTARPEVAAPPPIRWLSQDWLEPRLVVVTALAIILGVIGEHSAWPEAVLLGLNVIAYIAGGFFGAKAAFSSLLQREIDVDLLMILAALGAASIGDWREGAILLFLFSLSNVLQEYAIGRSRRAIQGLLKLYPDSARVRRDGEVVEVGLEQIQVGDIVLIEPGERIPVDGVVVEGRSAIDESPITGESIPVDKTVGDRVFAGSLNKQGILDIKATKAATDTTLARIIQLVEEAQESKAPTERFLERFEQRYALLIIVAVALFIVIPPALGLVDFESNFYRAMVLMTVASPCALVISVPAAFISAIASAARAGVLFKGGAYLEALASIKVIAFDKTGTLTQGQPAVTDVISCCEMGEDDLLAVAATVEARSEHPLAQAIVQAAEARGLTFGEVSEFDAVPGQGITARVDGEFVRLGSIRFLQAHNAMPEHLLDDYERLESQGKTVIGVVRSGECARCGGCEAADESADWMGIIALADQIRPEAPQVIAQLRQLGIESAMLTGDNPRVAHTIAGQVGITRVYASLMPEEKVTTVQQLRQDVGPVAMVGDGVNDAPALAMADVGIAMGAAGTDVALETADLVLMGDSLPGLLSAIALSRKARRVVWQNITFSIAVIIVLIFSAFVLELPLPLGVLGHEGSTVIVVLNGLIALLLWPELQRRRAARAHQ